MTQVWDAKNTGKWFGGMAAVLWDGCCYLCWCCRRTPPMCGWEEGGSTATGGTLWQRAGDEAGIASIRKGIADDDGHDCRLWHACIFMFVLCVGYMVEWKANGCQVVPALSQLQLSESRQTRPRRNHTTLARG